MRKFLVLVIVLIVFSFVSCKKLRATSVNESPEKSENSLQSQSSVSASALSKDLETQNINAPFFTASKTTTFNENSTINYDFTKYNYNVASSIIFDMMVDAEKYVNKTAKIYGQYYSDVYEGFRIFSIIVWDATACCPAGLTIVPVDGTKFPEDFPELNSYATVSGTLQLLSSVEGENLCLLAEKWEY